MSYNPLSGIGKSPSLYEKSKQRFGKLVKDYNLLGELRRQKKAPHVEVLYVWAKREAPQKGEDIVTLRSVPNCTNDQLQQAIRDTGKMLEDHLVNPLDAEYILDLLYLELHKRVKPDA